MGEHSSSCETTPLPVVVSLCYSCVLPTSLVFRSGNIKWKHVLYFLNSDLHGCTVQLTFFKRSMQFFLRHNDDNLNSSFNVSVLFCGPRYYFHKSWTKYKTLLFMCLNNKSIIKTLGKWKNRQDVLKIFAFKKQCVFLKVLLHNAIFMQFLY